MNSKTIARRVQRGASVFLGALLLLSVAPGTASVAYAAPTTKIVDVYVLDTGVFPNSEFTPVKQLDFTGDTGTQYNKACDNHGTSISGLIGGKTVGVAPGARIFSLKVFSCRSFGGNYFAITDALKWVRDNHDRTHAGVVNMSLTMSGDIVTDTIAKGLLTDLRNLGLTVVSAAGNQGKDSCNYSPGRFGNLTINVGALDNPVLGSGIPYGEIYKGIVDPSNQGACIDIWTNGEAVGLALNDATGKTRYTTNIGTSDSAPIVTGFVVNKLAVAPTTTPDAMLTYLYSLSYSATKAQLKPTVANTTQNKVLVAPSQTWSTSFRTQYEQWLLKQSGTVTNTNLPYPTKP